MKRVVHIPSGEMALSQEGPPGFVLLQFDRFDHPHSHGWHQYPASEVRDL